MASVVAMPVAVCNCWYTRQTHLVHVYACSRVKVVNGMGYPCISAMVLDEPTGSQ